MIELSDKPGVGHAGDDARGVVVELLDERGETLLVEGGVADGGVGPVFEDALASMRGAPISAGLHRHIFHYAQNRNDD